MAENKHNPDHAEWMLLLDQLETDLQNGEPLTEEQIQNLEELRALVAETSDALELYAKLDVKSGWQQLHATARKRGLVSYKPTSEARIHKHSTRRLWKRVAAVAALLLVMSISGYFLYQQQQKRDYPSVVLESDVRPGRNRATLTLADGNKIDLSDQQEGIIIGDGDIKYIDGSFILPNNPVDEIDSDKRGIDDKKLMLSTPRGGQYQVRLPDGTIVWLNAASKLTYPARFTGEERRVELEGEAYFEVAHNPKQPFIVTTYQQEVKVLGTRFNINAYKDELAVKTSLLEGSVCVSLFNHSEARKDIDVLNQYFLKVNEQIQVRNGKAKIVNLEPEEVIAWKNGYFMFDNEGIESIMRKIGRWYNVEIEFESLNNDQVFTGTVSRFTNVSKVLEKLELTGGIKFKIVNGNDFGEGRRIIVM